MQAANASTENTVPQSGSGAVNTFSITAAAANLCPPRSKIGTHIVLSRLCFHNGHSSQRIICLDT